MNIGQAAQASGISAKMLRHYESTGLIPPTARSAAGYRTYGSDEVETLRFIRRARDLGLTMERVKVLVALWRDKDRPSRAVKTIALEHVAMLEARIAELTGMRDALAGLAHGCKGDAQPECPILRGLAGTGTRRPVEPRVNRRAGQFGNLLHLASATNPAS